MKIVFATNNQHKLSEVRQILGDSIEVLSLNDIGCHEDIPETGTTLEANALGTQTEHGVTILDGHGWYTGKERKVICLLARKSESTYIFRLIKMIDSNAFVSQSAVIGVFGEGFDTIKINVPKDKKK